MTGNGTIRPATPDDDDRLAYVDAAAADPGTYVVPPKSGERFFGGGTVPGEILVGELDGRIVGYVKVRPPTPLPSNAHVLQVQGLAVAPEARRRGVARMLLAAAAEEARRRGATKLSLRVLGSNPSAQALYRSCGFEVEGVLRGEFRIDGVEVDDVLMARQV